MDYLFRLPKFPVILDTGETLICAKSRAQFESKVSKIMFADTTKRDIIDSKAEGFALHLENMIVAPGFGIQRWTKREIIELYNSKRQPGTPELRSTSLSSRSLELVVREVVELLSQT